MSPALSAEGAEDVVLTLEQLVQTCQCVSEAQRLALQEELRRLQRHGLRKQLSQRVYGLAPAAARARLRHGLSKLHTLCSRPRADLRRDSAFSTTTLSLSNRAGRQTYLPVKKLSIGTWVWSPDAGTLAVYYTRAALAYQLEAADGRQDHNYRIETPLSTIRRIFLAEDGGDGSGLSRIGLELGKFCLEFSGALHLGGDFTEGLQGTDFWVHYLYAVKREMRVRLAGLVACDAFCGEVDECLLADDNDNDEEADGLLVSDTQSAS